MYYKQTRDENRRITGTSQKVRNKATLRIVGLEQAQTLEFEILEANPENVTQSVSNFTICVRTEERRVREKELREGWWKKDEKDRRKWI